MLENIVSTASSLPKGSIRPIIVNALSIRSIFLINKREIKTHETEMSDPNSIQHRRAKAPKELRFEARQLEICSLHFRANITLSYDLLLFQTNPEIEDKVCS